MTKTLKSSKKKTTIKRRAVTRTAKLLCKPHALMGCVLLGLVACSSGNNGNVRHKGDYSGGYSPYGGTQNPTAVKLGKAYTVNGTTYYPRHEQHYVEQGIASWYGPTFHGRATASGEQYDQNEMTAAHRTLPLPSMVRVTRLDTGSSVIVRINDRGPFSNNRIIDLSKEAASELDMVRNGTAKVKVEYLPAETRQYIASLGLDVPDYMMADTSDIEKANLKLANVAGSGHVNRTKQFAVQKSELRLASNDIAMQKINAHELPPVTQQQSRETYAVKAATLASTKPFNAPVKSAAKAVKPQIIASADVTAPKKVAKTIAANENKTRIEFHPGKPSAPLTFVAYNPVRDQAMLKPAPQIMSSEGQQFRVQTAAFSNLNNAKKHVEELSSVGKARIMPLDSTSGVTVYRVILGPVSGYNQAMSILHQTKDIGYKDARIMVE